MFETIILSIRLKILELGYSGLATLATTQSPHDFPQRLFSIAASMGH